MKSAMLEATVLRARSRTSKIKIAAVFLVTFLLIGLFQFSIPKALASPITIHVYSTRSEEGLISNASSGSPITSWVKCRNGSNLQIGDKNLVSESFSFTGFTYIISRVFEYFNTSSIPQNAIMSSVTLNLYAVPYSGDVNVSAQRGTQATPLTTSDWNSFSGNPYGVVEIRGDLRENYTMAFNSQGIGNISKGGITEICLREYVHDYLNESSPLSDGAEWSAEPYLEITYSLPTPSVGGVSAPTPMFSLLAPWLSMISLLAAAVLLKGIITKRRKRD